jgi:hypothetical protein
MIHYEPIALILQPDDLAHRRRDLDNSGQIMLPHLGHYFFNAFLVGVPTTRARQTGVAMGCLVSSEEQHPAALQSFDARILKKRVIPLGRLASRGQGAVGDRPNIPDISSRWLIGLRVGNVEGFTPTVLLPDKIIVSRSIS